MSELALDDEPVDFLDFDVTQLSESARPLFPSPLRAVVAIPVHNEEERIEACLQALQAQDNCPSGDFGILLHLNNCTDRTEALVRRALEEIPGPVRLLIQTYDGANAGWARRCAMDAAADWLAEEGARNGVILTTDADSRVPAAWVRLNLEYIDHGADAVAGRIALDEDEAAALPAALHERGALESAYEALLTEIDATLDPQEHNPWPCHWTSSGATLAVRRDTYLRCGGLPAIPLGEDRAFVAVLRAHDARVRHAPDIIAITSGRLDGRAPGGAADTMKTRCQNLDSLCDPRLESVWRVIGRGVLRRLLRRWHGEGRVTGGRWPMACLGIPEGQVRRGRHVCFGDLYATIERTSPFLDYRPIRPRQIPMNIRLASMAVKLLRSLRSLRRAGRQAGIGWCGIENGLSRTRIRTE